VRRCRSILRRGSRFTASDLSYHQTPGRSTADQTGVDDVPRRRRNPSTDVAGQVALLASIPLAHSDDVVDRQTSVDLRPAGQLSAASDSQNVDVHDRGRSVSFDDDIQLSPHTEESRQVEQSMWRLLFQQLGKLDCTVTQYTSIKQNTVRKHAQT